METEYRERYEKNQTPTRLARFVQFILPALVPRRYREQVVGDFVETVAYGGEALKEAADAIPNIVSDEIKRTFKWRLILAQGCVLYVAFAGSSVTLPIVSTLFVLVAALTALVLRDAYTDPDAGSPHQAIADGVVTVTFVFTVEVVLAAVAPRFLLPYGTLIRGTVIGLLLMVTLRSVFWRTRAKRPANDIYQWSWKMHGFWVIGCLADFLTRLNTVERSQLVVLFVPMICMVLSSVLKKYGAGSSETADSVNSLFQSRRISIQPRYNSDELLFLLLLMFPAFESLGHWLEVATKTADPYWLQGCINMIAFVATLGLCVYVLKYSPEVAR